MNYLNVFYKYCKRHFFCKHKAQLFLLLSAALLNFGCASTTPDGEVNDPFEPVNRGVYQFNEELDRVVMKPLAEVYQKLPDPVQTGTHNFFSNLNDVVVITNDILQLKLEQSTSDVLRFSVNTVLGICGLIDIATPMGLPKHEESFADTFGYWGVGSGPYIVLPFFGSSSLRDAPSLAIDFLVHPTSQVSPTSAVIGLAAVYYTDVRSNLLKSTDLRDELALDPYVFTRESYYQWRQNRVYDGDPPKLMMEDFEEDF